jgi:enoyl-CoA hydratase/carnithine racemase
VDQVIPLLSGVEASELFDGLRSGRSPDRLGIPLGSPVLLFDLDDVPAGADLRSPPGLACVLVGVSAASVAPPAPAGPDVLLSAAPDAPAPWVSGGDGVTAMAGALVAAVRGHPQAATTLAQVLRIGAPLAPEAALVVESLAYATLQAGPEHRAWLADRPARAADAGPEPAVTVERVAATLAITLDRPGRRNAYSIRMRDELVAALQLAAADPSIAAVELRGRGPNFCSGGDLAEFGTRRDPATAHVIRMARSAGWWISRMAPRVTVHLHGACVGAGIELAAFAANVEATADATMTLPEVGMGLIPGAGGTASIPRRIGAPRTAWLALSGRSLDASTARRWGLVDRLVPDAGEDAI